LMAWGMRRKKCFRLFNPYYPNSEPAKLRFLEQDRPARRI
jgi:hypothetical protein